MVITLVAPINFFPNAASPEVDAGQESMVLTVKRLAFEAGKVEIDIAAQLCLPGFVGARYGKLRDAAVLVVNDVENVDGGVLQVRNDFIEYADDGGPTQ